MSRSSFWKVLRQARSLSPRPISKAASKTEETKESDNSTNYIPIWRANSLDQYHFLPSSQTLGPLHRCDECGSLSCCDHKMCQISPAIKVNSWKTLQPYVTFKSCCQSLVRKII